MERDVRVTLSLILPHNVTVQGHSRIPYLFRIRCSCGFSAYAPDLPKALTCKAQHLSEEEPFPDLSFLEEPKQ